MRRVFRVSMVVTLLSFSALCLIPVLRVPARAGGDGTTTLNGDTNGDGALDTSDAIYLLLHLFKGGPPPTPVVCADSPDVLERLVAIEQRLDSLEATDEQLSNAIDDAHADSTARAEKVAMLFQGGDIPTFRFTGECESGSTEPRSGDATFVSETYEIRRGVVTGDVIAFATNRDAALEFEIEYASGGVGSLYFDIRLDDGRIVQLSAPPSGESGKLLKRRLHVPQGEHTISVTAAGTCRGPDVGPDADVRGGLTLSWFAVRYLD